MARKTEDTNISGQTIVREKPFKLKKGTAVPAAYDGVQVRIRNAAPATEQEQAVANMLAALDPEGTLSDADRLQAFVDTFHSGLDLAIGKAIKAYTTSDGASVDDLQTFADGIVVGPNRRGGGGRKAVQKEKAQKMDALQERANALRAELAEQEQTDPEGAAAKRAVMEQLGLI